MTLEEICGKFIRCRADRISPVGDGHINDTFLVCAGGEKYILQRLQKKMDLSKLEYNFDLYSPVLRENHWLFPEWKKTKEGRYFFTDPQGENYRMYPFIEGEVLTAPLSERELLGCGQGIARLHDTLSLLQSDPKAVYPALHDLKHYYDEYQKTLSGDNLSADNRDPGIEKIIDSEIGRFLECDLGKMSVVHGDTKIANILFESNKAIAFIDLDTAMTGYPAEDIADCIRSCCVKEGKTDTAAANLLISGYIEAAGREDAAGLKEKIPFAFDKIVFELALRYYTDSISVKKHFKEKYPGYRIERVRSLLDLKWE